MNKRKLTLVMFGVLLGLSCLITYFIFADEVSAKSTINSSAKENKAQPEISMPLVSNNENQIAVSDRTAFILFLRFLSKRDPKFPQHSRNYLRQTGFGNPGESGCLPKDIDVDPRCKNPNIEAITETAEIFNQRVSVLDANAKAIKDKTWPNPNEEVMGALINLQRQKEQLADEMFSQLRTKLDPMNFNQLQQHLATRIKRLTKIMRKAPNPLSPEWHEKHNHK